MLPLISASNGSIIFWFRFFLAVAAVHRDESPKSLRLWFVSRLMLCNQKRENSRQQHENERLHNAHEYFHKIEGKRQERREPPVHRGHRFQNAFAGIDVPEKPKAQRDRSEQNRDDFKPSDHEKDNDHDHFQKSRRFALWSENVKQESPTPLAWIAQIIQSRKKIAAIA